MKWNPSTQRKICWNGLELKISCQWEAIVLGKSHLLFENDFQPVLELRWNSQKTPSKSDKLSKIIQKLQKELDLPITETSTPMYDKNLPKEFSKTWLTWHADKTISGVILQCHHCGTTLLIRFYHPDNTSQKEIISTLSGIICHRDTIPFTTWAIQDFQIEIPSSYQLENFNLAAGYTNLSFYHDGSTLHICRIAAAQERLLRKPIEEILTTLLTLDQPNFKVGEEAIEYTRNPSIFRQILMRLKRKKPFCWAKLWHYSECDRLLGVIIESIRPVDVEKILKISHSYVIFPTQETSVH